MAHETLSLKAEATQVLEEVLLALCNGKSIFSNNHFAFRQLCQPGEATMLEKILKLGEDYSVLKKYIASIDRKSLDEREKVGLYTLTFAEQLDQVLEPYYHDILLLEEDITANPQTSLHYVWSKIHRHSELLCSLNSLAYEIVHQNVEGCMILQHLQDHLVSDVGLVKSAVEHIIEGMNEEFFSQITNWLLYGELVDPYDEFFIHKNPVQLINEDSTPFEEYCVNLEMLPRHVSLMLAEKILNVGQMVLFLRSNPENLNRKDDSNSKNENCINENGIFGDKEKQMKEKISNIKKISKWDENKVVEKFVGEVSSCVTQQLWTLAVHNGRLTDEFKLVKEIFLLGRGELFHDFVVQIDCYAKKGLSKTLDLNQIFQESARRVLIKEESLTRFSIELQKQLVLIKGKKEEGDLSHITVKYDIPWPLQLLFTSHVLNAYNSIFRFLLRLKKIQVKLVDCWLLEKSKRYRNEDSLKRRQLLRNLWFLVNNLQYYLHVDVLDSQFMIFETAVEKSKDFEEIQKAHLIFIENLISQLFIHNTESESSANPVYRSMNKIIELCEEYCYEIEIHSDIHTDIEIQEEKIDSFLIKFDGCVEFLLKLLTALTKQASHPCSQYLSQFLLRLDFNSFFSNQFSSNQMSAYT